MASADVKLTLKPSQLNTIIAALEAFRDEHADEAADEKLTPEERSTSGGIMWACDVLLRELNG